MTRFFFTTYLIIIFLWIWGFASLQAQTTSLHVHLADKPASYLQSLSIPQIFPDKKAGLQYVEALPNLLASKGYISASVDTLKEDSANIFIDLFIGEKYVWKNLLIPDSVLPVIRKLGYEKPDFINRPYDKGLVEKLYGDLLDYYASTGFPFAKIGLQDIVLQENMVSARLLVDSGFIYTLDSINLVGNASISQYYLQKYLAITPREPYNADILSKIDQRLQNLTYLVQSRPWDVTMTSSGAILNLYLDKKAVNEIDAIIGFGSGDNALEKKLKLNGQVKINLRNAFGGGEFIGFNWQQLQPRSPRVNLAFNKPYLFKTPVGVDFGFDLYKFDSAYVNIKGVAGISYSLSTQQTIKLLANTASSRLLSVDTNYVIMTKRLPAVIDYSLLSGELAYLFNNTDYLFNPRKGTDIYVAVSTGIRNVKKNNSILQLTDSDFDYGKLYDTIVPKSYQFRIKIVAAHYLPVGKQSVLKTAFNGGWLQSESAFMNELFQLGGYRLLRGFNEESIFADKYMAGIVEYRYLIGQNSYFFGFADGGWAHQKLLPQKQSTTYISGGLGMAFQTRAGIFNLAVANGKQSGQPFNFNRTKVHVGYTALF